MKDLNVDRDPILAEFFVKLQAYVEDPKVSLSVLYTTLIADAESTPLN
uniref:Putative glycoside hydrolase family 92 protein n=1 Tax=Moniliophthora roreri TaxID=221103 RepID=A0A0W0G3X1_MONRR